METTELSTAPPRGGETASRETVKENTEDSPEETENGTPVSQLQKRLALIMPLEAKNKGENV